jgi:hypothetical protein
MSKWIWILLFFLAAVLVAAAFIGIKLGKFVRNDLMNTRYLGQPPNEYLTLLRGPDSANLQFLETILKPHRHPITRYRYLHRYEILETKITISDTGDLNEKFKVVRKAIPSMGFTDNYAQFQVGRIDVDFKNLDGPDSIFKKVCLIINDRGFENTAKNDSVIAYRLPKGYFGIGRNADDPTDIFSDQQAKKHGIGYYSVPTALLFKRRGNNLFLLVASPLEEGTTVPDDLLIHLLGDK